MYNRIETYNKKQNLFGTLKVYGSIFESTGTGMGIIEADGTLSLANQKLADILQTDVDHIIGTNFLQWIDEADTELVKKRHAARLSGEDITSSYEIRLKTSKETLHWVSVNISFFPETSTTIVSFVDIDPYKRIEHELKNAIASQNALFDAVPDLMFELNQEGRYLNIWASNPEELASTKELLLGHTVQEMLPSDAAKQVMQALQEAQEDGKSFGRQLEIETPEGILWFELSVSPIKKDSAEQNFILLSRNITDRKKLEEQLKELSTSDPLTGLCNRRKLEVKISKEIEATNRNNDALSLLFLDVDHFKQINDTYGHDNGDIVLQSVAQLLKASVRETDNLFRYGGEEFVLLMTGADLSKAEIFAERLRSLIEKTEIELSTGQKINITVSIGVADLNNGVTTVDNLIKVADARMYVAKNSGRNCVVATDTK